MPTATVKGGVQHGAAAHLSHAERIAAHSALSKLSSKAGGLGSHLGSITQSATLMGGSHKAPVAGTSSLAYGSGSDTFVGGARSSFAIGNDTVVSGSSHLAGRGVGGLDVTGAHTVGNFALSSDTINIAGATASGVKAVRPEDANTKAHTVTLADKTTVTITGLSSHDVSKISH
jgi:hypothetical protein